MWVFQATDRAVVAKYGLGRLLYFCLIWADIPWDKWPFFRDVISFLRYYYPSLDQRLLSGTFWVAIAALLLAGVVVWLLNAAFGPSTPKNNDKLVRGAKIIHWRQLAHQTAIPAWKLWQSVERARQLKIGQVPIPFQKENLHILLVGSTGTGKSQALYQITEQLRKRNDKAFVLDLGGALFSRFAAKGDKILNPLDSRSLQWNPFLDIQQRGDLESLVQATIPSTTGESEEWRGYARTLMIAVLGKLASTEEAQPSRVVYYATQAGTKELAALCAGTQAQRFFEKGNEKMLSNSLTNFAQGVASWTELQDGGNFSMRKWVRKGRGWLYINIADNQFDLMRPLVSTWAWLAIIETLSLPENHSRRLWFMLDELASYNQLPKLAEALAKLRKYGGCVVAALQDVALLDDLYGHDQARAIRNCFSTFLALRCEDPETSRYAAQRVGGEQVIESVKLSTTTGQQSCSQTRSIDTRENEAVASSEIRGLPNLVAYLKIAGGYSATIINIPVSSTKPWVKAFVSKEGRALATA